MQNSTVYILGLYLFVPLSEFLFKKYFDYATQKKLEKFKNNLIEEVERIKINETQLHNYKTKEFVDLLELLCTKILDKDYVKKLSSGGKEAKEFNKRINFLGAKIFLFAKDETVKKFVEWKKLWSQEPSGEDLVYCLAELVLIMRIDLGYTDTICISDDFLYTILKDYKDNK